LLPWSDAVYFQGVAHSSVLPKGLKGSFFLPLRTLLKDFSKRSSYKDKIAMACSQFSATMIEEAVKHKVQVLYPPVSDYFKITDANVNSKSDLVLTVSRFSKEKRLEIVPEIAALSHSSSSFIIAGACRSLDSFFSLQNAIRRLGMEKKVQLMPNISRTELRKLLQKAKVYLHTGENEPFGVSILEAMSSGCITVVPNSGGPKEFVTKQFRYETVEEAAQLVDSSISKWSPQLAEEFVNISGKFSEETFSKEFLTLMGF
jgi:glycosyltransferase involved in cell wall biosynthesis